MERYYVKVADLEKDKQIIVDILKRNRTRTDTDYAKRFNWIYLNNPFGQAIAWIIYEGKTHHPVGFTGVFPRPVFVDGKEYIAWNCGDFSIDKKYRTLGVALKLRREAKNAVDEGKVPFLYAHPNKRMEVIHFRVGHKKISEMHRYALPLKVNRYLKNKITLPFLADFIAFPINLFIKLKFMFKRNPQVQGEVKTKVACSDQHEALFLKMKDRFRVIGTRSCTYLNWKYAEHPNFVYHQFDCYQDKQLIGSIFFLKKDQTIHINDVMVADLNQHAYPVMVEFIYQVLSQNLGQAISFILQKDNPLIPILKEIGFQPREDATSSVIAYANETHEPQLAEIVLNGSNWYMTVGDRDA